MSVTSSLTLAHQRMVVNNSACTRFKMLLINHTLQAAVRKRGVFRKKRVNPFPDLKKDNCQIEGEAVGKPEEERVAARRIGREEN